MFSVERQQEAVMRDVLALRRLLLKRSLFSDVSIRRGVISLRNLHFCPSLCVSGTSLFFQCPLKKKEMFRLPARCDAPAPVALAPSSVGPHEKQLRCPILPDTLRAHRGNALCCRSEP